MPTTPTTAWQRHAVGCWTVTLPNGLVVTVQRAATAGPWTAKARTTAVGLLVATGRTRTDALRRLQSDYWFPAA